jgi:hypothetical protein
MTMIGIYGASDDLVEVEIDRKPWEEFSEPHSFTFTAAGKALHVDVEHDGKRGWKLSTVLDDEKEEGSLPFSVSIHQRNYSPLVLIQVHAEPVVMTWVEDGRPRSRTFAGATPPPTSTEEP